MGCHDGLVDGFDVHPSRRGKGDFSKVPGRKVAQYGRRWGMASAAPSYCGRLVRLTSDPVLTLSGGRVAIYALLPKADRQARPIGRLKAA
jgi:hypothetical protein